MTSARRRPESTARGASAERRSQFSALLIAVASVVLAVFVFIQLIPGRVRSAANPSFVDNIFDNTAVLVAVRLALLAGAMYVIVSVGALIKDRRWLSQLGPFKASDQIVHLNQGAEAVERNIQDAVETIEELNRRLGENNDALVRNPI
jgi:hypothetical protein